MITTSRTVLHGLTLGMLGCALAWGSIKPARTVDDVPNERRPSAGRALLLVDVQTQQEASFALYLEEGMVTSGPGVPGPPFRQLIAAGWDNGLMVWRTGAPVDGRELLVSRNVGATVAHDLARELFGELRGSDGALHYGPDSEHLELFVCADGRCVRAATWHEGFELNPNLVCTEHGVGSLAGRSRDEVLAECSAEYRQFRSAWASARAKISAMAEASPSGVGDPFLPERLRWSWR